ncbi:MAG: Rieske 2Fe-2S domain-containing protein [Hyphomicrobiales bacterium]|nr:Rieske 2Fe-2S domain-containing protein [Hyphomicrobiales bacterium]
MQAETTDLIAEINRIADLPGARAQAMPPGVYRSQELLVLELERIFMREWICVGRADALKEPGSYITTQIGDQPVAAVRQRDGSVKAFANVCLHRMMVLLQGEGQCKRIVCPYHAWTYDIDGRLIGAPEMTRTEGFDKADYRLPELRTEVWEGWLYVSMNPDIAPVAERLRTLSDVTGRYRQADYVEVVRQDHVWNTNWKLLTENFMEGYHLPVAHRATVGQWMPFAGMTFPPGVDPAFTYQTFKKEPGATYGIAHKDNTALDGEWRNTSVMPTVFPAHMWVLAPDHLWYLTLSPKGTGEVRVRFGAALAPEVLAGLDDPEGFIAETIGFFDQVNAEDKFVVEGIYAGARAPLSRPGPLSWLEREIHDFIRYLAHALGQDNKEQSIAAQ